MSKTVILIDDDQDDLDILKQAILSLDPSTLCLSFIYPEEALRLILKNELLVKPDHIFIDINMPGISGDKCLKAIRASKSHDDIVITMYSTSMPETVAQALKLSGANYTFEKPVKLKSYTQILEKIFLLS